MSQSLPASAQVKRVLVLKRFAPFNALESNDLAAIAEHTRLRSYPRGSVVLRAAMPVRALYFILEGSLRATRPGRETRTLSAGNLLGSLAALTDEPQAEQVVADTSVLALELHREALEDVFEERFSIFVEMLRALARVQIQARKESGPDASYPAVTEPAIEEQVELGRLKRISLLRSTMSFANAHLEALADLAEDAEVVLCEASHYLWREGDRAHFLVIPASGFIECTRAGQCFSFGPRSVVGALDSVCDEPRWYTARSQATVRALRIETHRILDVMEDHPEMAVDFLRQFAATARELSERVSFSALSPIA